MAGTASEGCRRREGQEEKKSTDEEADNVLREEKPFKMKNVEEKIPEVVEEEEEIGEARGGREGE